MEPSQYDEKDIEVKDTEAAKEGVAPGGVEEAASGRAADAVAPPDAPAAPDAPAGEASAEALEAPAEAPAVSGEDAASDAPLDAPAGEGPVGEVVSAVPPASAPEEPPAPPHLEEARQLAAAVAARTLLVVGGGSEALARALRREGLVAHGVHSLAGEGDAQRPDIRAAIAEAQVAEGLRPPFPQVYDLALHTGAAVPGAGRATDQLLDSLCSLAGRVALWPFPVGAAGLGSPGPTATALAKAFARRSYYRPAAPGRLPGGVLLFERRNPSAEALVESYELALAREDARLQTAARYAADQTAALDRARAEAAALPSIEALEAEKQHWQSSYEQLLTSTSWRVTKPLRAVKRRLSGRGEEQAAPLPPIPEAPAAPPAPVPPAEAPAPARPVEDAAHYLNEVWFRKTQPLQTVMAQPAQKRLNLVLDSMNSGNVMGGVATAVLLATCYARAKGMPLRIITRDHPANPAGYDEIMALHGVAPAEQVSFYSDADRDERGNTANPLDISEEDIFMATGWWTAVAIRKTTIRKRFFYLVQDVETFFHPQGDESLLCVGTYEDPDVDYLVNSRYLWEYFEQNYPVVAQNGMWFSPAFNKELYKPAKKGRSGRRTLFFYARMGNPRNLFHFGLQVLDEALRRGVLNPDEWELVSAGTLMPDVRFSTGQLLKNAGVMPWRDYAAFLAGVDLTFSLMYTPHPSYPPFDAAMSGGVVVSNSCYTKTEFRESKNVLLGPLELEGMLKKLAEGALLAKNDNQRRKNWKKQTIPGDWEQVLAPLVAQMAE